GTPPERVARALERAGTTVRRGAKLTDQVLAFSRKSEENARPILLDAAVRDTCELLRTVVGDQIVLELDCQAPSAIIMADTAVVEQTLLTLAANARDAMPSGGVLAIATEAILDDAKGPQVKLVVRDTGSGMTPETTARIFEPFFTTKEVGQGT